MRIDASSQHLATDQNPRPVQGVLWTLQGSAFYSLLFIFPNLWGEGLSPYQLAWFRFVGGFVSLTPLMVYFVLSGQSARLLPSPGLLGWHALRAAFGALTFLCSIVAVLNIDQANASAITMTSGVFTVALAMLFLRERPNRLVLFAGVIALSRCAARRSRSSGACSSRGRSAAPRAPPREALRKGRPWAVPVVVGLAPRRPPRRPRWRRAAEVGALNGSGTCE